MVELPLPSSSRRPARFLQHLGILALLLLFSPGQATSQLVVPDSWKTDGSVYAAVYSGNTLYIGGAFSYVGPQTGAAAPFDLSTGLLYPAFDQIQDDTPSVTAITSDGQGGWFLSGAFTTIGGVNRQRLAHLDANFHVTAWNPVTNSPANSMVRIGSTLYLGGNFTTVGGQPRNRLAAVDVNTGAVTSWNPDANGEVRVLVANGSTILAGGSFTGVSGMARTRIAGIDAGTGLPTPLSPSVNATVSGLAVDGSTLYACGSFTNFAGQTRNRIAAVNATTGLLLPWNPNADGQVSSIVADGATVYAGGNFAWIGGATRKNLAALDATTGTATAWNPDPNASITTMTRGAATLFVGGVFEQIGGQPRRSFAELDLASGLATSMIADAGITWYLGAPPPVLSIGVSGSTLFIGGDFSSVGGRLRRRLAALDATLNHVTEWNPNIEAVTEPPPTGYEPAVRALLVEGSTVYAGGYFTRIGGVACSHLVALDAVSGLQQGGFSASVSGNFDPSLGKRPEVYALARSGSMLYAGGQFNSLSGSPRSNVGAVTTATGAVTSWNTVGSPSGDVRSLAIAGSTVYAGGLFTFMGGQARNYIAALDATSGTPTAWNPNANGRVQTIVVSGSNVLVGGQFTSVGGQPRARLAALDATTGTPAGWNPGADDEVLTITPSASVVYVGGQFTQAGGQARSKLAAIDLVTGAALDWNPGSNAGVFRLEVRPDGNTVYAGGQFSLFGGAKRLNLAAAIGYAALLTVEGPRVADLVLHAPAPQPIRERSVLSFDLPSAQVVSLDLFDPAGRRVRSLIPGTQLAAGRHQVDLVRGDLGAGLYFVRLRGGRSSAVSRVVVVP